MTAPATTRRAGPFNGNGVTTSFPFTFKVFTAADIAVVVVIDGVESTLASASYSVTLNVDQDNSPGGSVSYSTLDTGDTLTIVGAIPYDQTADLPSGGNYRAIVIENALDRTVFQIQQLAEIADRSVVLPPSSTASTAMPPPEGGTLLGWNIAGTALQNYEPQTGGVVVVGAEDVAYATPGGVSVDMATWANRFKFVANYGTNLAAVQAALNAATAGDTVFCTTGATYTGTLLPVIPAGVTLDMQGATFTATLGSGNVYGVRLGNYSVIRNGTVNVTSTGTPSSQFIFHAAISLGEANSNGGTAASPSLYSTVYGWRIERMVLSTTRPFTPVIQGAGNLYNGVIDGITIPDNSACSGVHFDWSDVGSPVSSSDIAGTRAAFDSGLCYTTHPHNIVIRNIRAGNLSVAASADLGSSIVRLSACYNIHCENLYAENVTLTGYRHVGGDLGFEFARAIDKPHACRGNTVKNMVLGALAATGTAEGVWVDTFADNIYREQFLAGYVPLLNPLMHGNVVVEDCDIVGPNADLQHGARIIQARGVTLRKNTIQKWRYGVWVDEFTRDIVIDDNTITANREDGVRVGFAATREGTIDVTVSRNRIYGNGTASTGRGVNLVRSRNARVIGNTFGSETETTQAVAVAVVDDGASNFGAVIEGNHCAGDTVGAWALTDSSPQAPYYYRQISLAANNTCDPRVPAGYGGQAYIPLRVVESTAGLPCRDWLNPNTGAPTDGTWYRGERLIQALPSAAGIDGHAVVTSGTFGTLSGLTNAATTNGSANVTMSLSARTANTTANSYSIVVSSATDLRLGLTVTIAAAGIADAVILAIGGTTVVLDAPAKSTQTGAALVTPGVVEGEVISINSTPVTSGMVRKTVGSTVTLSSSAGSTETGRTVSYVTPVFKAQANLAA